MKRFLPILTVLMCLLGGGAQAWIHGTVSGGGGGGSPVPAFSFNFPGATSMPANTSFATAFTETVPVRTYFDSNGDLQTAAINAPRFGYDFWAHTAIGLIVEGGATNVIRNNTAQGSVVGTARTISGITGLSRSGSASAVLLCSTCNAASGDLIQISGASVGTYNGAWLVTAATSNTSITFKTATSATDSATGETVAGSSPGTLPTNWSIAYNGITGLGVAVVGKGTQNNIEYVDLRVFGAASAAGEIQIYFESTNNVASGNGARWVFSEFLQLVGGNINNIGYLVQDIDQRNASNAFLSFAGNGNNVSPTSVTTPGWLRFGDVFSTNQSTIAFVSPCLRYGITAAAATDITLRDGLPQLEASSGTTSVIRTTNAAVARSADIPSFTGAAAALVGGASYSVVSRTAGSTSNNAIIGAATSNFPGLGFINPNFTTAAGSGISQLSTSYTTPSFLVNVGLSVGGAARYLTSNGGTLRGGTTASDAANIPLGTTFGTDAAQFFPINGSITSIDLYNTPLTQLQLETATNPTETTAWGNSVSAGTGSSSPIINYGYVGNLNALTQQTTNDQGVGGESADQITTRMLADNNHTNDNVILEMGRNNITGGMGIIPFIIADIQSCINHLAAGNTRYVVLSVINAASENSAASGANLTQYNTIIALNAAMASNFPGHYLDVRSAIVLASQGANDAPASTFMNQQSVHPNDAGYQVMALAVQRFGLANNWPGYGAQLPAVAGTVPGPSFIQSPDNLNAFDWGSGAAQNATSAQAQGTAPDGSNNLNTIIDNATNGSHFFSQGGLNPPTSGIYTWSVYLKQNTLRYAHISLIDNGNGNTYGNIFDLQAGTVGVSNTIGSPTGTSASIEPVSMGGFTGYKATITMQFNGVPQNLYPLISTSNSATPAYDGFGSPTYAGSGQNFYVWNASLTTPISIGTVSVPATQPWITAGYNLNTFHVPSFGPNNVDVGLTKAAGFQWYLTGSFGFADTSPSILTFNMDGSLTVDGALVTGGAGGGMYSLAAKTTPVTAWHGQAFGGGFYTEATLSFDPSDVNNAGGVNGFPAWWADPMEHGAQGAILSEQWQGQAAGYVHFTETDFWEYNVWNQGNRLFQYNGTVIDWSGIWDGAEYPFNFQNSNNRLITLPVGTDFTKPHRYGFLWVPATISTLGYFQWYFDGLPTSDRVTYSKYDCSTSPAAPAASNSPWLYGVLDCQHPELLFNPSGTGKLRVHGIDVWQNSTANNIVK